MTTEQEEVKDAVPHEVVTQGEVPSVQRLSNIQPLTEEERKDWNDYLQGQKDALVKLYSMKQEVPIYIKIGEDQDGNDHWKPKVYKYHRITIGEQRQYNRLRAKVADLEYLYSNKIQVIAQLVNTVRDNAQLRTKIQEALAYEQERQEKKSKTYNDLMDARYEWYGYGMDRYYRVSKEDFEKASVTDFGLALDIADFNEKNLFLR
jgi:hypothetical protein